VFGRSISVSGSTVVVSAPWDDDAGSRSGSAYVLEDIMPCPAALTCDGTVDVLDLLEVVAQWGTSGGGSGGADITGDGTVDVLDLLQVLGAWDPC